MTARPRRCPNCRGAVPADSDFCPNPDCRAYLAWEDPEPAAGATAAAPLSAPRGAAADPATATTAVALPAAAEEEDDDVSAMLVVSVDGVDVAAPEAAPLLRVAPGSALSLTASVRNESELVQAFVVGVDRLPADWVEVRSPTLHLLPIGPDGDFEGTVTIVIRPPETSEATAGPWPFAVTVRTPEEHTRTEARLQATLTVLPFVALEADVEPRVAAGRRRGTFVCEVTNAGNAPAQVATIAKDDDKACTFDELAPVRVDPGATVAVAVVARPVKPIWVGRPAQRKVAVQVQAAGMKKPLAAPAVLYRQLPWIPWWVPPALVVLAAAAVAIYALLPKTVTMPAVVGDRSALQAQGQLDDAGFKTHPVVKVVLQPRIAAGTVVGQVPKAGSRVAPTSPVTLQVAGGPATTIVPRLAGLRPKQADAALARVHLLLGQVSPKLDPKARIASQIPAAGAVRRQGTAINVVLAPRLVTVPDVRGHTPLGAERMLHLKGLKLGTVQPKLYSKGLIASQLPAPTVKRPRGSAVNVVMAKRRVKVPDLVGDKLQDAAKALATCDLKLGPLPPTMKPGELIVRSQVPGPHTIYPPGTPIIVVLGKKGHTSPQTPPTAKECRVP